jgi:hypothetical protein
MAVVMTQVGIPQRRPGDIFAYPVGKPDGPREIRIHPPPICAALLGGSKTTVTRRFRELAHVKEAQITSIQRTLRAYGETKDGLATVAELGTSIWVDRPLVAAPDSTELQSALVPPRTPSAGRAAGRQQRRRSVLGAVP